MFTRDVERGVRFALRVQAGLTHVNDAAVNDDTYRVRRRARRGAFRGPWAIEQFTTAHWVSVQRPPQGFPPG